MNKEKVINDCNSLLRRKTPLYSDCGKICQKHCCNGDRQTGMLLFPGEEKKLIGCGDIFELDGENDFKVYVCGGSCNRNERPLFCRMYPLFPLVTEKGEKLTVEVIPDPRADCPLLSGTTPLKRDFVRAVKRAGEFLLMNGETKDFLLAVSDEVREIAELKRKIVNSR